MNAIFVWTLSDVVGLVGLALVLLIWGSLALSIKFSEWRDKRRNNKPVSSTEEKPKQL